MKGMDHRPECGCHHPQTPTLPPCDGRKNACQSIGCGDRPRPQGSFLMQKILACGQLHRRRFCYSLCVTGLPCQAVPPFQVIDAAVCGQPRWEEIACHERGAVLLEVTIPLCLRIRDCQGCVFTAESSIRDQIRLRLSCPEQECWRGQIFVQAAVRFCGPACESTDACFDVPLETLVEGYILSPCAMGAPCPPPCPEPRPWYPQPRFDPWKGK